MGTTFAYGSTPSKLPKPKKPLLATAAAQATNTPQAPLVDNKAKPTLNPAASAITGASANAPLHPADQRIADLSGGPLGNVGGSPPAQPGPWDPRSVPPFGGPNFQPSLRDLVLGQKRVSWDENNHTAEKQVQAGRQQAVNDQFQDSIGMPRSSQLGPVLAGHGQADVQRAQENTNFKNYIDGSTVARGGGMVPSGGPYKDTRVQQGTPDPNRPGQLSFREGQLVPAWQPGQNPEGGMSPASQPPSLGRSVNMRVPKALGADGSPIPAGNADQVAGYGASSRTFNLVPQGKRNYGQVVGGNQRETYGPSDADRSDYEKMQANAAENIGINSRGVDAKGNVVNAAKAAEWETRKKAALAKRSDFMRGEGEYTGKGRKEQMARRQARRDKIAMREQYEGANRAERLEARRRGPTLEQIAFSNMDPRTQAQYLVGQGKNQADMNSGAARDRMYDAQARQFNSEADRNAVVGDKLGADGKPVQQTPVEITSALGLPPGTSPLRGLAGKPLDQMMRPALTEWANSYTPQATSGFWHGVGSVFDSVTGGTHGEDSAKENKLAQAVKKAAISGNWRPVDEILASVRTAPSQPAVVQPSPGWVPGIGVPGA